MDELERNRDPLHARLSRKRLLTTRGDSGPGVQSCPPLKSRLDFSLAPGTSLGSELAMNHPTRNADMSLLKYNTYPHDLFDGQLRGWLQNGF